MESKNALVQIANKTKKMSKFFISQKVFKDFFGKIGFILIVVVFLMAIFAPYLSPFDPDQVNVINKLASPSRTHLMGTDHLGRDVFSRMLYGSRISLAISIAAVTFASVTGTALGMISGYGSETLDHVLRTFFDIIRSFPSLIFAIAVIIMLGTSGIPTLTIVIGFTYFPRYARLIRAQTLKVKKKEYLISAKAIGQSDIKIMFKHILPNIKGPMFIMAAMDIPSIIAFEAGLSFLGLGVNPPTPSWGTILRNGYLNLRHSPWMVIFGGGMLIFATLGFTFLGEALRDAYDPRLKNL
ncbi:ABC transporter permease [Halanaerobium hydrogeniformans]|uniref:Binding-protein-dependent transport systems inner membrane component n=1 Tax=Halanaerobium hydrogeniformans TaxID=656519 RepID=E4RJQ1_HALHG|nr:ABC transporter permease [Halanaerobium hydrogeniformans]ADQ15471.1 binding-protein-dependent transport systems inner membrane component [Halanaerobium hydrogeniformans]